MSENAQRFSKRHVKRQFKAMADNLGARLEKRPGQLIINPRTAMKSYVKWTASIRRAMRPLAEQFGLKVIVDENRVIYHY